MPCSEPVEHTLVLGLPATAEPISPFLGILCAGDNCFVNRNCYFDLEGKITLGDDVVIGHGSTFITTHHEIGPSSRRAGATVGRAIEIHSGTWIGANVIILPGVTIGSGAIVAAGAVVSKSVPANSLAAGIPAKVVRTVPTDVKDETLANLLPLQRG